MNDHKVTDHEKQTFQDAMEGVKRYAIEKENPVTTAAIKSPAAKTPAKRILYLKQERLPLYDRSLASKTHAIPVVTGHDIVSFAKTGLQRKKFSRLKQEKTKIEATLDLHEHTSDEALIATDLFIENCRDEAFRTVCIIHGKGLYSSNNNPVLKNLLNSYLRLHEGVIAFHSSKNNTGSMVVLLKSR